MSDEYISREAAISHPFANGRYDFVYANKDFIQGFVSYKEWLEDLPAADVKPAVKGKWSRVIAPKIEKYWCSECKGVTGKRSNFCPHCGADMRKER